MKSKKLEGNQESEDLSLRPWDEEIENQRGEDQGERGEGGGRRGADGVEGGGRAEKRRGGGAGWGRAGRLSAHWGACGEKAGLYMWPLGWCSVV